MIAIVISKFNTDIVDGLYDGCIRALGDKIEVDKILVPGAFELPSIAHQCVQSNKYKAVITLGCVIKGDTDHYDYICQAVSNGIMNVTLQSNIPVLFGVLTCQNAKLAFERSRDNKFNKGFEVGIATKDLLNLN